MMIKVIETNLSMKDNEIMDHQSRVILVDSWESYVDEIKNGMSVNRTSFIGSLHGNSLPKQAKIENFKSTDKTLSCDVVNFIGMRSKKLAYRV